MRQYIYIFLYAHMQIFLNQDRTNLNSFRNCKLEQRISTQIQELPRKYFYDYVVTS